MKNSGQRLGKIIVPTSVFPEKHELMTANFFTNLGKDVEFLVPGELKTADIIVEGVIWEIKSPKAAGGRTLENAFRAALRQSPNIIFDLQRTKMHQRKCVAELTKQFELSKRVKRLLIIKKSREYIVLER